VVLFDRERSGSFVRRDPNDFWYDCEWTIQGARDRARVEEFFTEEGRLTQGSSIWFEDPVGHVSTAERTWFVLDTAGG